MVSHPKRRRAESPGGAASALAVVGWILLALLLAVAVHGAIDLVLAPPPPDIVPLPV